MPPSRKMSSNDLSTAVIEQFIKYNKLQPQSYSLNEIIHYFMCPKKLSKKCLVGDAKEIADLRDLCDSPSPKIRSQLLSALTNYCAKTFSKIDLAKIIDDTLPTGQIVAAFHNAAEAPSILSLDLSKLTSLEEEKREVILFCIKKFVPELIISGNFVKNPKEMVLLDKIVASYAVTTSLTYKDCQLEALGTNEMAIFLKNLTKANHLVLDNVMLDKWTEERFKQFVEGIKQNPQISYLSLEHTHLDRCCANAAKFESFMELIQLKQFSTLNLHGNHLGKLPADQLKRVAEAIQAHPKNTVKLHLEKNKSAGSRIGNSAVIKAKDKTSTVTELGLFATSLPVVQSNEASRAVVAGNQSGV